MDNKSNGARSSVYPSAGARMTMSMSAYLRKYSIISAVGIVLAIFQSTFFGELPIFGATPDLVFMFVLSLAFADGWVPGCIAAVAGGFLLDVLGADGASPLILFYLATALAAYLVVEGRLSKNLLSWVIVAFSACTLKSLYRFLYVSAVSMNYNLIDLFGKTIIPEYAATVIFSIPVYFAVRKIVNSF